MSTPNSSPPTSSPLSPEWLLHTVLHPSASIHALSAHTPTAAKPDPSSASVAMATLGSDARLCVLRAAVPHESATRDAAFDVAAIDAVAGAACVAFDASNRDHVLVGCRDGFAHVVNLAASNGNFFFFF